MHRECVVKYNSYFEFPRELDMSPYTAAALAKLEGNFVVANNVFVVLYHLIDYLTFLFL